MSYTLSEIAARLGGQVRDDNGVHIRQVASLAHAQPDQISFLADRKFLPLLTSTRAGAVLVPPQYAEYTPLPRIVTENPYAYYARLTALLNPEKPVPAGIDATAKVAEDANIAPTASIGPYATIAQGASIGEGCVIGAGCHVGADCVISARTRLYPNVVIYQGCRIGVGCILHSGAVIGADGFGHAPEGEHWVKIPQIGRVVVGDQVEIGANTTIDRGALDDTVIEDGVKLDNLIQIGHNCRIGADTVIAGCVGIAGSTRIGRHCRIGGAAMILGHLEIADGVTVSPGSMITRSITQAGTYTALMPFQPHASWLKTAAQIRHLDALARRVSQLEQELNALKGART